jgi:hypothetical protein
MSHSTVRVNKIAINVSQESVFVIGVRRMTVIVGMGVAVTSMGMKLEISVALEK